MTRQELSKPPAVRAIVVDDEGVARRRLRSLLERERDVTIVGEAADGTTAVQLIASEKPDLVFLDVEMPEFDGFDVLRATMKIHHPFVVFVTAHNEHAIRAFEFQAVDYLLKPIIESRFREAVRRVVDRVQAAAGSSPPYDLARLLEQVAGTRIAIKQDGRVVFVAADDIDWIEADGDIVRIHAGAQTHTARLALTTLEERLPRPRFLRIHRSIIVNADRIREIQPWFKGDYVLVLRDGTKLRSSRSYRTTVQELLP